MEDRDPAGEQTREWAWFRRPRDDEPGTTNLCYNAVDVHVVRGAADLPAVRRVVSETTYAGLLASAAALGGALTGLGAGPGDRVAVRLADPADELLAVLAVTRLGAAAVLDVPTACSDEPPRVLLTDEPPAGQHLPQACILRGPAPMDESRDVTWELAMQAGGSDPAPCEPVPPGSTALVADGGEVTVLAAPEAPGRVGRALATLVCGGVVEAPARP